MRPRRQLAPCKRAFLLLRIHSLSWCVSSRISLFMSSTSAPVLCLVACTLAYAFQVKGAVHVFSQQSLASADFNISKPLFRIPCERAAAFFPSPERPGVSGPPAKDSEGDKADRSPQAAQRGPYCAVFSKEVKGAPATLEIFDLSQEAACVAKKCFFQAQEAECQWAYDGRAVLIKAHTDASDLTYYGSSALYFLKVSTSRGK